MRFIGIALVFATVSSAMIPSVCIADTQKALTTPPAAICSLDNAFQLIQVASPVASPAPTPPPTQLVITDQQKRAFLIARISACKDDIDAVPRFAKSLIKAQVGNIGQADCNPTASDIFVLFNQLERCVATETALAAVLPPPTVAFHATRPVLYVIMNSPAAGGTTPALQSSSQGSAGASGGGRSGGGSGQTGGGNSGGGGNQTGAGNTPPATSGAATSSIGTGGIDNPSALLLYDIAIRLSPPGHDDPAFVIPATQWSLSNYYSQCLADPPRDDGGGTYGALLIDASTTTNGGQFALLIVSGWSYVKYSATLLKCQRDDADATASSSVYPNNLVWHGYAEGKSYRSGVSFLPIGIWLTYQSTKWV